MWINGCVIKYKNQTKLFKVGGTDFWGNKITTIGISSWDETLTVFYEEKEGTWKYYRFEKSSIIKGDLIRAMEKVKEIL